MFRKMFSGGGLLLLAGAVMFVAPGLGQAQHGGGGFGGGHGVGGHFGGGGFGGAHFSGGRFGGAHLGGYEGGYPPAFYHPSYSYRHDGRYSYYPYYYGTYPYLGSGADYGPGYYGLYGTEAWSYPDGDTSVTPPAAGYQAYYSPVTAAPNTAPPQSDGAALVTAVVPADAEIWFEGIRTTTTGSVREYQSPPLTPGNRYTYEIRARWNENGHEMDQTQQVSVTAGAHVNVSFPVASATESPKAAGG